VKTPRRLPNKLSHMRKKKPQKENGAGVSRRSKEISYSDPSSFWGKDALQETIPKLGVGPHSNHFTTLWLKDVMRIHLPRHMVDRWEKESDSYILEFSIPKEHVEPYPPMAKMLNFWSTRNGLLMRSYLPKEPSRKFNVMSDKRFKSSKWRDQSLLSISTPLTSFILEDLNILSLCRS